MWNRRKEPGHEAAVFVKNRKFPEPYDGLEEDNAELRFVMNVEVHQLYIKWKFDPLLIFYP